MAGNTLGPRKKVKYTTDSGVDIRLSLDADKANLAGAGLSTAIVGTIPKPTGFKPRGVYVTGNVAADGDPVNYVRKFIVCAADSSLYASDQPQAVTIDGVSFVTTGRRGESQRFI